MATGIQGQVVIVGSGFSGIGTAIRLMQSGVTDIVLLERSQSLGGTWRENSYPGCACDVPSRLYSFSFAQNPEWTRSFSAQPEIWAYLQRVAEQFRVLPLIRFGCAMRAAHWDASSQRWNIDTSDGGYIAPLLVLATGGQSEPELPNVPGLERFQGVTFHSARWRHDYELRGKRVGVIGTGASAIQFVPAIQPQVAQLHLFQRTAPWVLSRRDRAITRLEQMLYRALPAVQSLVRGAGYTVREASVLAFRHPRAAHVVERVARAHLARQVSDPALRSALTPTFTLGCKRVLVSDDYYPSLTQPNVSLVTASIREVQADGILTSDGVRYALDALVLGTGFRPTDPPLAPHIVGRDGRTLAQAWSPSMVAYASTTVSGFPNLFVIPGPNSGIGHTSLIYMIESQISHVIGAVRLMRDRGLGAIEPTAASQQAYVAAIDRRMRGTVWAAGGCRSWYMDASGRISTLWPDFSFQFRRRVARLNPAHYLQTPRRPTSA